jgi:hypothetical protein
MRKFFTLLWLLCPVAALYYHFNEGQNELARLRRASTSSKSASWSA